jgi:ABC-type Mn2+/Zn2+ transport system ATPase subunit
MIGRLYADNYKCFVNFEYKPRSLELILGDNGSGKSTNGPLAAKRQPRRGGGQ